MRREIQRLLLETKLGDRALRVLEQTTGMGLVRLEEIEDVRAVVTQQGRLAGQCPAKGNAAKSRAPARD